MQTVNKQSEAARDRICLFGSVRPFESEKKVKEKAASMGVIGSFPSYAASEEEADWEKAATLASPGAPKAGAMSPPPQNANIKPIKQASIPGGMTPQMWYKKGVSYFHFRVNDLVNGSGKNALHEYCSGSACPVMMVGKYKVVSPVDRKIKSGPLYMKDTLVVVTQDLQQMTSDMDAGEMTKLAGKSLQRLFRVYVHAMLKHSHQPALVTDQLWPHGREQQGDAAGGQQSQRSHRLQPRPCSGCQQIGGSLQLIFRETGGMTCSPSATARLHKNHNNHNKTTTTTRTITIAVWSGCSELLQSDDQTLADSVPEKAHCRPPTEQCCSQLLVHAVCFSSTEFVSFRQLSKKATQAPNFINY
eukprot:g19770.t1